MAFGLQFGQAPSQYTAIQEPEFQVTVRAAIGREVVTCDLQVFCKRWESPSEANSRTRIEQIKANTQLKQRTDDSRLLSALFATKLVLDETKCSIGSMFPEVDTVAEPIVVVITWRVRLSPEQTCCSPQSAAMVTDDGARVLHTSVPGMNGS